MTGAKKMTRTEWSKTPYAKSEAKDADGAILTLLTKYKVALTQITHGVGAGGRPCVQVRFKLGERVYAITREALNADVQPDLLLKQVKRALYHRLKVTLEEAVIFPPEEALFPYLELPAAGGVTIYQAAQPALAKFQSPEFGRLMLPPADGADD